MEESCLDLPAAPFPRQITHELGGVLGREGWGGRASRSTWQWTREGGWQHFEETFEVQTEESPVKVLVVHTDEELAIAQQTVATIAAQGAAPPG